MFWNRGLVCSSVPDWERGFKNNFHWLKNWASLPPTHIHISEKIAVNFRVTDLLNLSRMDKDISYRYRCSRSTIKRFFYCIYSQSLCVDLFFWSLGCIVANLFENIFTFHFFRSHFPKKLSDVFKWNKNFAGCFFFKVFTISKLVTHFPSSSLLRTFPKLGISNSITFASKLFQNKKR